MNKQVIRSIKNLYFLLGIIVLLAFVLRIYGVGSLPASIYWDEAAIGYNAYSIAETLKDEYGNFLPLLFRSYDDYKMPLYIYLLAVPVKIFGLSEFTTRLPSAIFGTLTVAITFFLVREMFDKSKSVYVNSGLLALLSTILLAISPWHIQFSRGAFEANLALFFVLLGVLAFFKGLRNYNFLILSFVSFSLTFYSYRSILVFLPVLIFGLLILYRKELLRYKLKLFLLLVAFLVVITPIVHAVYFQGSARASQTSIANEVEETALKAFEEGKPVDKKLLYPIVFANNFIKEFSPGFLFMNGDPNLRHSPNGIGMLYLWEAPFLLIGLLAIFKYSSKRIKLLLTIWVIAAILPAAVTTPAPHALRSLNILPVPQILIALGVIVIARIMPNKLFKIYSLILLMVGIGFLVNFIRIYEKSYSISSVGVWGDGYKQLYSYLIPIEEKYDSIIVSGEYWQPYAYALFYKKYDPGTFQSTGSASGFSKYYFGGTSWDANVNRPTLKDVDLRSFAEGDKIMVALSPGEFNIQRENILKLHEVRDLQGNIVFITGVVK